MADNGSSDVQYAYPACGLSLYSSARIMVGQLAVKAHATKSDHQTKGCKVLNAKSTEKK